MTTASRETFTAGVYVEYLDAAGNCVGHAVFADWDAHCLPEVGDALTCVVTSVRRREQAMSGRVLTRKFDVQRDAEGRACVWIQLFIRVDGAARRCDGARADICFSRN
jgi:hypothetical protein